MTHSSAASMFKRAEGRSRITRRGLEQPALRRASVVDLLPVVPAADWRATCFSDGDDRLSPWISGRRCGSASFARRLQMYAEVSPYTAALRQVVGPDPISKNDDRFDVTKGVPRGTVAVRRPVLTVPRSDPRSSGPVRVRQDDLAADDRRMVDPRGLMLRIGSKVSPGPGCRDLRSIIMSSACRITLTARSRQRRDRAQPRLGPCEGARGGQDGWAGRSERKAWPTGIRPSSPVVSNSARRRRRAPPRTHRSCSWTDASAVDPVVRQLQSVAAVCRPNSQDDRLRHHDIDGPSCSANRWLSCGPGILAQVARQRSARGAG